MCWLWGQVKSAAALVLDVLTYRTIWKYSLWGPVKSAVTLALDMITYTMYSLWGPVNLAAALALYRITYDSTFSPSVLGTGDKDIRQEWNVRK